MSNIDASADSVEELAPIVARIRERWPAVKIWLRGDGGFCRENLMAWCEREGLDFIFGLAQNARLKKQIEPQMTQAQKQYEETKAPARVFTEFLYATQDTWTQLLADFVLLSRVQRRGGMRRPTPSCHPVSLTR